MFIRKAMLRTAALVVLLPAVLLPAQAYASEPYKGYTFNSIGDDVRSINGYVYADSVDGSDMPGGAFKNPESLFAAEDDTLYLVDTGNNRILHFDKDHKLLHTLGPKDGPGQLNGPKGIYVKRDGTAFVADTKNHRIAVFDASGNYMKEFKTPSSPLLGKEFSYSPSKLVLDKRDYMFVISDGNTQGLMQIDPRGDFKGFYGANHIGFSWQRLLIKWIATKEQRAQISAVKPSSFSSIAQDQDGFIYTTTLGEPVNQLKRLSPVGVDTLNVGMQHKYGDMYDFGPLAVPTFMSISVSRDGFITAMDLQTSKIFQYDKLGNLLFVFGGTGEQKGLFTTPAGIAETSDGSIYVVDKGRNRIDRFRTTPFARLVHDASKLYVDGQYEQAESLWKKVLQLNANFDMAYLAIGKSLYKSERYREAMDYFQLARSKGDYSAAFREYRKVFAREHFAWIVLIVVLIAAGLRYAAPKLWKLALRLLRALENRKGALEKGGTAS